MRRQCDRAVEQHVACGFGKEIVASKSNSNRRIQLADSDMG